MCGMRLGTWLEQRKITHDDFAAIIGTSRAAVSRYVSGERVPAKKVMPHIVQATGGAVTANDFMEAPECAASEAQAGAR